MLWKTLSLFKKTDLIGILPASPDDSLTQGVFKIGQLLKESGVRPDRSVLSNQLQGLSIASKVGGSSRCENKPWSLTCRASS